MTEETPKPAIPVGGRPFLDYLVENAARFGFTDIVLLCGYLSHVILDRYDGLQVHGATVRCVVEPEAAGTGGALVHARDILDDTFYMMNGDSLFDINLLALAAMATAEDWTGRLALRRVEDASRYGIVETQGTRITGFAERGPNGPGTINGGVYLLRRSVLDHIHDLPCSIERDIFPQLAAQGLLHGVVEDGFFIDIGIPDDLARAQKDVPAHLARPAAILDAGDLRDGLERAEQEVATAVRRLNDAGWLVLVEAPEEPAPGAGDDRTLAQRLGRWGAHADALGRDDDASHGLLRRWHQPPSSTVRITLGQNPHAAVLAALDTGGPTPP